MSKLISILCLLMVALSISACNTGNSPDQQRSRSRDAQGELSTEVNR